jgi:hypothetical protein
MVRVPSKIRSLDIKPVQNYHTGGGTQVTSI